MRIIIVGGVAAGMSAAARARRHSEEAEIIVLERGPRSHSPTADSRTT
jgi:NADPH-dependent 2,4-dienoyl-CoA reductase/sulfur reductase-like enzyme